MRQPRLVHLLAAASALLLAACSGNIGSSTASGASADLELEFVSNGFGELLPYQVQRLGSDEEPTSQVISIRTIDDILANVRPNNPIRPVPTFSPEAILPSGEAGNHFLYAKFSQPLLLSSVLSSAPGAQSVGALEGSISVVGLDPITGDARPIEGRAFVGGRTFAGTPSGSPLQMPLQTWVTLDPSGNLVPNAAVDNDGDGVPDGLGFPGTEGGFAGAADLVGEDVLVFVVDSDDNLATHEAFPSGVEIRMRIGAAVTAQNGKQLKQPALAATTVGQDTLPPEVALEPPPNTAPRVTPSDGSTGVDPLTDITIEFTEPIQILTLGDLPDDRPPTLSAAIGVQFGPDTQPVQVPFTVLPKSPFDLTTFVLHPAYNFPGEGPEIAQCGVFNRVQIFVNAGQFTDLSGNVSTLGASSVFETGEGPGLVNAPVAPEAIYVARNVPEPGVSIIDLNGFGASTGNPLYDETFTIFPEGWSNYPNNPNVKLQGSLMRPALAPPTCTIDGGSAGVFTLTKDSALNDLLVRAPIVLLPGDMMLGHALDSSFNNGPAPFGCQSGGGNLCAIDGQKLIQVIVGGPNTITPPILNNPIENTAVGGENMISWAPHPNPPPLQFPPLCVSPFIGGQEPTSVDTTGVVGLQNLLVPGDPFGQPNAPIPVPPSGLLSPEQNAWFQGPSLPVQNISACSTFMIRQQVGQYLYVIDRARSEVVVLNSNRMTVIDRIVLPDPTELAMSPNLNLLAVSNQGVDLVSFIDIDPSSATLHQVIHETVVGSRPRGIAWEPGNEDILVCNEDDDTVSIISAFSLEVRKTVSSQLDGPFAVSITPRQQNFGFLRGVYFAWILNRSGRVAIFESGPNSVNGWGYDDVIGITPQEFRNPKTLQPDHIDLRGSVWVVHEGPLDPATDDPGPINVPAVTNIAIESGIFGQLPLNVQSLVVPQFRDMSIGTQVSIGPEVLSGIPTDIAFDNMRNMGGLVNFTTQFSAGVPVRMNGKSLVRQTAANGPVNTSEPEFMFLAVPNPSSGSNGVVDVVDIGGGFTLVDTNAHVAGFQSVLAPGAVGLMDYFRQ